jgi:hypothetical protein
MVRSLFAFGLCLGWSAWLAAPVSGAEFKQSFLGQGIDGKLFRTTGNRRTLRPEAEGLRITLNAARSSKLPCGLVPRVGVHGDFEITMGFHVLQIDRATKGSGAGVSIYIATTSPRQDAATLARQVRADGTHIWAVHRATTPPGGRREHHGNIFPTDALSGRLRLVRRGPMLSYLVAGSGNNEFRELFQSELGEDDLGTVRFAAGNDGGTTTVDVRITGVGIRADDLGAARRVVEPEGWSPWLLTPLLVPPLAAGGWWLWRRRERRKAAGTS